MPKLHKTGLSRTGIAAVRARGPDAPRDTRRGTPVLPKAPPEPETAPEAEPSSGAAPARSGEHGSRLRRSVSPLTSSHETCEHFNPCIGAAGEPRILALLEVETATIGGDDECV